jgi:hypothetical protein
VTFELDGQPFMGLNAGAKFTVWFPSAWPGWFVLPSKVAAIAKRENEQSNTKFRVYLHSHYRAKHLVVAELYGITFVRV